jgi:hypothetical protein
MTAAQSCLNSGIVALKRMSLTGLPMSLGIRLNRLSAAGEKRRMRKPLPRMRTGISRLLKRFVRSPLSWLNSEWRCSSSSLSVVSSSLDYWNSSLAVSISSLMLCNSSFLDRISSLADCSSAFAVSCERMISSIRARVSSSSRSSRAKAWR